MPDSSTTAATHEIDSRHGYAMLLMVLGSVAISFGGLVLRNMEVADTWQINVYRSLGLFVVIAIIIAIQNHGRFLSTLLSVGRFGVLAGVLLAGAGLSFIQAFAHTTIANALFIIASRHLATAEVTLLMLIEFALGPVWVWLFVDEVPHRWTLIGGSIIIASVAVRAILELMNKSRPQQTPGQPV